MKIEEGKFYKTRGGDKIGPMQRARDPDFWESVSAKYLSWTIDGKYRPVEAVNNGLGLDLIEEWVDEPAVEALALLTPDPVNHPAHYTGHPSGVECIQITEHMNFCRGNAVKYIWRAGEKGDAVQDLEKAIFYLKREISRLQSDAVKKS